MEISQTNLSVAEIFSSFQSHIDNDQDLREEIRAVVKDIETTTREILTTLQVIHHDGGLQLIAECCLKGRELLKTARTGFAILATKVPPSQYYRYNDNWRFVTQRLAFLIALIVYLEGGHFVSREQVAQILGVHSERADGFHIDLEDYLMGLLQLASELSRFAVNSVTNGDYARPMKIFRFVTELNAGFRLLNLKNDSLRKRFDGLKYDLKKVEEVVYDLSIRGLKPNSGHETVEREGSEVNMVVT